jgi:hypothetical protein
MTRIWPAGAGIRVFGHWNSGHDGSDFREERWPEFRLSALSDAGFCAWGRNGKPQSRGRDPMSDLRGRGVFLF